MRVGVIATAFFLLLATHAWATGSVELKVTGNLILGSCNVKVSPESLDLGSIPIGDLPKDGKGNPYIAQHQTLDLSVNCSSSMKVALYFDDPYKDKNTSELSDYHGRYAFVSADTGEGVGAYRVYLKALMVDGKADKRMIWASSPTATSWGITNFSGAIESAHYYSFANQQSLTPTPGQNFDITIDTDFHFAKSAVSQITDRQEFKGQATFTIYYL